MVNIYGSAEDNAAAPTGSADYAAKPVTTSVTSWAGVDSFNKANNIEYASAELKRIIQEIISRPKWAQGNAILLLIKDNNSSSYTYRNFISTQDATYGAFAKPHLYVQWYIDSTPFNDYPQPGDSLSWTRIVGSTYYAQPHPEIFLEAPKLSVSGALGNLSGLYRYAISYIICDPLSGELLETTPSPVSAIFTNQDSVTINTTVNLSGVYNGYRIYRTLSNKNTLYLLDTLVKPSTAIYIDNIDDSQLSTSTTPRVRDDTILPVFWATTSFPSFKQEYKPIAISAGTGGTTVASGKTVYLHTLTVLASGEFALINDTRNTQRRVFTTTAQGTSKQLDPIPITSKLSSSTSTALGLGYEVFNHDGLIPIVKSITSASGYTVPNGKNFILTGIGHDETECATQGNYSATSGSPSTTVNSAAASSMAVDVASVQPPISGSTMTPGGGQTSLVALSSTLYAGSLGMSYKAASAGAITMSWTPSTVGAWSQNVILLRNNGTITNDAGATKSGTTGGTPSTTLTISNVVVANNANRVMLVGMTIRGANASSIGAKSVTFGGAAMKLVRHDNRYDTRVEMWALVAPAVSTANVVITLQESTDCQAGVAVFYNCQQEVNNVTLDVKLTSTSSQVPVATVSAGYGNVFGHTRLQQAPQYLTFKEGNQLLPSSTITTGVTIWGYEY